MGLLDHCMMLVDELLQLGLEGNIAFFPMTIGDYVTVGAKSVVCAAHIGPVRPG